MIVLDEQLLGRGLEVEIARWYRGTVCFITDIRPASVIKDDAMPTLLHQQKQATFVTINEIDFWRKVEISHHFCVICFTLSDARATELPGRLRKIAHHPLFATKAQRMGKVIRVSAQEISYYTFANRVIQKVDF